MDNTTSLAKYCCGSRSTCENVRDFLEKFKCVDPGVDLGDCLCYPCSSCQADFNPYHCCVFPAIFADAPGRDPDDIIHENEPVTLRIAVAFYGAGAKALMCLPLKIRVLWFFESIGTAPEIDLQPATIIDVEKNKFCYVIATTVPAGTFKADYLYKPGAILTLGHRLDDPDCPDLMNGYVEGGTLQVFK